MNNINLKEEFKIDNFKFIHFTKLTKEEKDMVLEWRNDDSVRRWMINEDLIVKEDHYKFIKGLVETNQTYYWVIKNQAEEYLGVLSLFRVDHKNRNAYYGIYANPKYQSPGIGMLFNRLIVKLVFEIIGLHTLKQEAIEGNDVIEIHQGMGFKIEGKLKDFVLKDGQWKDIVILGMKEEDYFN